MSIQIIKELTEVLSGENYSDKDKEAVRSWLAEEDISPKIETVLRQEWEAVKAEAGEDNVEADYEELIARIGMSELDREYERIKPVLKRKRARAAVLRLLACASVIAACIIGGMYLGQPDNRINFCEHFVPNGQIDEIVLPDGTNVKLNSGSIMIYPDNFNSDSRSIFLMGEALFDVVRDADRPFLVRNGVLEVEVLGTTFNMSSYPDADEMKVTLVGGEVVVAIGSGDNEYALLPGQQFSYNKLTGDFAIKKVNVEMALGWSKEVLCFRDASLKDIFAALERRFDIRIQYNKVGTGLDDRFNVNFGREDTLEEIFAVMKWLVGPFDYRIDGKICTINFR